MQWNKKKEKKIRWEDKRRIAFGRKDIFFSSNKNDLVILRNG